jgi:hypothetical protein
VEAKTLNEAHGREIASLNRQLANARADVTQLTAERDAAVAAKAAAEAQLTDFNARVAAEVKRLGLSRTPAGPDPAGSAGRKLTATEQVLAAKGVKTLAELGASAS